MSIGLDIGSRTVKLVELEESKTGWRLVSSGIAASSGKLPGQITDEKENLALAEVIRKLGRQTNLTDKNVSLALPEVSVFTRLVSFPLVDDKEIASAVKWEAEQYVPIPMAEAILQYQIVSRDNALTRPESQVLLVATPKDLVEKYLRVAHLAGLEVVGVETQLLALVRALAPAQGTVLLMDFGARTTDIAIAKNGTMTFSRSIPTAGDALTRALVQNLGVRYSQAEEYKKTYGLSTDLEGKIKKALNPVLAILVEEIKKAVHFYQTEEKGEAPQSLIVSGGSSTMPEVIATLSALLGLEVMMGDPFLKMEIEEKTKETLRNYLPLYAVAVGLAMREG